MLVTNLNRQCHDQWVGLFALCIWIDKAMALGKNLTDDFEVRI